MTGPNRNSSEKSTTLSEQASGFTDTPSEVEEILLTAYRQMSPSEKFARILDLNHTVELLAASRLRAQYGPELSDDELRLRLASLRLTRDTMVRVFGWDPEKEGY